MMITDDCRNLLKSCEGCQKKRTDGLFQAYPDPGSGGIPWTIGWGSTGGDITRYSVWTQAQCDARLEMQLQRFVNDVNRCIGNTPTTQHQFDALVDFQYNTGALFSSTLLKKHNARDYVGAAAEFGRWTKSNGKVLPGLVSRRAKERALYEEA